MAKSNREPTSPNHASASSRSGASASPPKGTSGDRSDEHQHERYPTKSLSDPAKLRVFAIEAARMLADDKCTDVVCLDVRGLSQVSDFIVIASGTSDRQMRSAADDVDALATKMDMGRFRRSEDDRATWVVLDCIDVVVHIFEPNTRSHYDLEMLWGDAERIAWERDASALDGRAGGGSARRAGRIE